MDADLDLLSPSALRDPYPVYRRLRETEPVRRDPRLSMWVVTRYDDVKTVVQDAERFSADRFGEARRGLPPQMSELRRILRDWAVYRDPPEHTRLRGLLAQSFTSRQLEAARPRIHAIVDDLLERLAERRRADFVADFAFPLPASVIASLLGVPTGDLEKVKVWSDQIAAYIGGAQAGRDNVDDAQQGLLETCDYFRRLARARRARPADDLLTLLLAADDDGGVLSEDELVSNCVLLLFAGHETTTNLLANGLFHLLRNPRQLEQLRRRPELVPDAVEELLRFDPPVSGTIRVVTQDCELQGRTLRSGELVAAMIASANHDPEQFAEPDVLELTRSPNRHLSFGHGIHFCLGAPLARLEAQIALRALLGRFARLEAEGGPPAWKPQAFFRGLKRLWVELGG